MNDVQKAVDNSNRQPVNKRPQTDVATPQSQKNKKKNKKRNKNKNRNRNSKSVAYKKMKKIGVYVPVDHKIFIGKKTHYERVYRKDNLTKFKNEHLLKKKIFKTRIPSIATIQK